MNPCIHLKDKLFKVAHWIDTKEYYTNLSFRTDPFEPVEEYGVRTYELDKKLCNLMEFWKWHVAPATNRPENTHLLIGIHPEISRIAERSYEVYCNIVEAHDELRKIEMGDLGGYRYSHCLNVFRRAGAGLIIFGELQCAIDGGPACGCNDRNRVSKQKKESSLFSTLNKNNHSFQKKTLFSKWTEKWEVERDRAIKYRNMLQHHGRPWYFFTGKEFEGTPYILRRDYLYQKLELENKTKGFYMTWAGQKREWNNDQNKFVELPLACKESLDLTVNWLNDAYGHLVNEMKFLIEDQKLFKDYAKLWGWK